MITMLQIKIKFFSGINQVNKYLLTSIESKYHENMSYNWRYQIVYSFGTYYYINAPFPLNSKLEYN